MQILLYLLILLISSIGISKSASYVIYVVHKIGRRFRVSDFTLGFFILGLVTSTPELFVGINAIFKGVPELSMGNLIGGIIVLLSLVIGATAVLSGKVSFKDGFSKKELLFTGFLLITPFFLAIDGFVSRFDGLMLLAFYAVFFIILNKKESFIKRFKDELIKEPFDATKLMIKAGLGVLGLLLFSKIIVEIAIIIANQLSIPPMVVGLLLLSLGTNMPEFTLGILSKRNHTDVAIGDYLGSAAANIPLLGLVAVLSPFSLPNGKHVFMLLLLVITVVFFYLFARSRKEINRKEGAILLGIYGLFLVIELVLYAQ